MQIQQQQSATLLSADHSENEHDAKCCQIINLELAMTLDVGNIYLHHIIHHVGEYAAHTAIQMSIVNEKYHSDGTLMESHTNISQ